MSALMEEDVSTAQPMLVAKRVTHEFSRLENDRPLTVLDDVSLEVKRNSFVSLIGPSGCGKSTLLRMLAGIIKPTYGEIFLEGERIKRPDARKGMVFQQDAVFPWLTVRQNIEYGPRSRGVPRHERDRIVEHWLHLVGLEEFADAFPKELSGGMRKRVDLARVYANDPEVLLMDEPFGALDAQTKQRMQEELLDLWVSHRKTVVFVTHDLDEALFLSDDVAVMSARPGAIKVVERTELARPRSADLRISDGFVEAKRRLWKQIESTKSGVGSGSDSPSL